MKRHFTTVDVFTDRPFGGNPLAVVTNAQGLSTEQMQAIAAEFNLAETTFVLPPRDPANTAEVRIFTPKAEMPFAGHPNVGTAFVLARAGESYGRPIPGDRLVFEEKAGLVRMELTREAGVVVAARLAPRAEVFARELPRDRVVGIHLYVQAKEGDIDIQSRMFAPEHGISEDPATGGANVALIGLLAHLRPEPDLTLHKIIGQGFDMGRPSILVAASEKKAGKVVATYIGGRCVPMMSGIIDLG
ncbi:MAG: PhzF family phenazine biosynthesis protein [Alphaproteobacteria bacterium]|nr:PhzF family phenazine biosynthesis protein [Alphaproteobacteria bacterium]